MADKTNRRQIVTAYVLCAILFFVVVFGTDVDIFLGGINYILSSFFVLILLISIVVLFIRNIISIFKNRKDATFKLSAPAVIYCVTLLLGFFLPGKEAFKSKVVLAGYHKGTQNQAFIKFRKNGAFEINSSAVFGYNKWLTGNYNQKGDTLFLNYDIPKPNQFGKVFLNKAGVLTALDKPADSTKLFIPFKVYKVSN